MSRGTEDLLMPARQQINYLDTLSTSAFIHLTSLAKKFRTDEGVVATKLVEWLSRQDPSIQVAIVGSAQSILPPELGVGPARSGESV